MAGHPPALGAGGRRFKSCHPDYREAATGRRERKGDSRPLSSAVRRRNVTARRSLVPFVLVAVLAVFIIAACPIQRVGDFFVSPGIWSSSPSDQPVVVAFSTRCRFDSDLRAVLDSRKGQAELSQVLGERVREAVEVLVQGHGEALTERCADVDPAEIYRASVRMVMRLVVALFAEAAEVG